MCNDNNVLFVSEVKLGREEGKKRGRQIVFVSHFQTINNNYFRVIKNSENSQLGGCELICSHFLNSYGLFLVGRDCTSLFYILQ